MSTPAPPRLLVCGFGAFPGVPANPAGAAVESLGARGWASAGVDARGLVLPVVWSEAAERALAAAAELAADAVLVVGVAVGSERFRVEARAANRAARHRPDAVGALAAGDVISPDGPAYAAATAPVEAMVDALRARGLAAEVSRDAGDYLCNDVFYRLLTAATPARAIGFLHVPPVQPPAIESAIGACVSVLARGLIPGAGNPRVT